MVYKPPVGAEVFESPVDVGVEGVRMHWRQSMYKSLVVDFCIELQVLGDDTDDGWLPAFRVDTSHGEVHHHQYYSSGVDPRRQVDEVLPDRGWEAVDRAWYFWLDRMVEEWGTYCRRWERG